MSRNIALWLHQHRREAIEVTAEFARSLADVGLTCVAPREDAAMLRDSGAPVGDLHDGADVEVAIIFGGDGSILRAAEWALERGVPLLGVNLGHVGFLAELEPSHMGNLAQAVVDRRYDVEERLTLRVDLCDGDGAVVWSSMSVNEVTVEKAARERMIELFVKVDDVPVSRWGCDGVLVASPTGSTAYAFSAGGPIVWPNVGALLLVPVSAHALFSSPLVLGPDANIRLELVDLHAAAAVVWCDGRRSETMHPGWTATVRRGEHSLRLARLSHQPFTERLVRKFDLRVEGWRGAAERRRIAH